LPKTHEVSLSPDFVECLCTAERIHLGIKDVTNDGIAELLIAADTGTASAMLGVYGMKDGRFSELAVLSGQYRFYVYEKGHIVAPYGSVGLYCDYQWENGQFSQQELCDPLRRRSAF
jgi:hypothetical protein